MPADDREAEEEFLKAERERLEKLANEIAATMLRVHGMECSQSDVERIQSSLWTLAEHLNDELHWGRSAAAHKKALLAQFRSVRHLSSELASLLSSEAFSSPKRYLSWVYGRNLIDDVKAHWGEDLSGEDEEWAIGAWILDHSRGQAKNGKLEALAPSVFELARASKVLIETIERTAPHKPVNTTLLVAETMVPVYWDIFPRGRVGGTGNSKYPRQGPLFTFVGTAGRLFGLELMPDNIEKTIKRYAVPMHGTRDR